MKLTRLDNYSPGLGLRIAHHERGYCIEVELWHHMLCLQLW
jgi:hypothetical protein